MTSIGQPGDLMAVRSFMFDDVTATYVVDGVLTMRPAEIFPAYQAATGPHDPGCVRQPASC
jgi:hypothetical protein